jgi:hypothetical protein
MAEDILSTEQTQVAQSQDRIAELERQLREETPSGRMGRTKRNNLNDEIDRLRTTEAVQADTAQDRLDSRDEDVLDLAILDANFEGSDEDILEASQDRLRLLELDKAEASQAESEQLAQRAIFRDQQANAQASQQGQAQINNMSAQAFGSNSALQGTVSSIGSQANLVASDLSSDSARLSSNLIDNISFLNQTFDLGGDISGANQNILQQQANDQARAQERSNLIGGITAGATIGASIVPGPTGAVVGAGFGLLSTVFDL